VLRVPVERVRVPVLRLAVLRVVVRPAEPEGLRADALPPRVPSVFAAAFTRGDVLRLLVERVPVERVPVLRLVVLRRVPVERVPVERVPVERVPVLRLLVLRPLVDRLAVAPAERVLVPVDLLRAVAICSS
jgi:hypothetical protein